MNPAIFSSSPCFQCHHCHQSDPRLSLEVRSEEPVQQLQFCPLPQVFARVTPHQICALTPLKINGWNMITEVWFRSFSFLNGWCSGSMLIFGCCNCELTEFQETRKRMSLKVWQHMRNQVCSCMVDIIANSTVSSVDVNLEGLCEVVPIAFPWSQKKPRKVNKHEKPVRRSNIEATQERNSGILTTLRM